MELKKGNERARAMNSNEQRKEQQPPTMAKWNRVCAIQWWIWCSNERAVEN